MEATFNMPSYEANIESNFRRAIFEPLVWVRIPEWAAGNCNSSAVEYGKQLLVVMSTQYAWNVD